MTTFRLAVTSCEVSKCAPDAQVTCTPLDWGPLPYKELTKQGSTDTAAPAPTAPQQVVVDNSVDHGLAVAHRKQIDAAKAQLLGTSAASLTYLVPKDPKDG